VRENLQSARNTGTASNLSLFLSPSLSLLSQTHSHQFLSRHSRWSTLDSADFAQPLIISVYSVHSRVAAMAEPPPRANLPRYLYRIQHKDSRTIQNKLGFSSREGLNPWSLRDYSKVITSERLVQHLNWRTRSSPDGHFISMFDDRGMADATTSIMQTMTDKVSTRRGSCLRRVAPR
jgi:hypothetical protein